MGIEPTQPAWEAGVLPLNYICTNLERYLVYSIGPEKSNTSVCKLAESLVFAYFFEADCEKDTVFQKFTIISDILWMPWETWRKQRRRRDEVRSGVPSAERPAGALRYIRLMETGDFYGDITLDKAQAQALAAALEKNGCEACHVPGVIDDFLAGAQF